MAPETGTAISPITPASILLALKTNLDVFLKNGLTIIDKQVEYKVVELRDDGYFLANQIVDGNVTEPPIPLPCDVYYLGLVMSAWSTKHVQTNNVLRDNVGGT